MGKLSDSNYKGKLYSYMSLSKNEIAALIKKSAATLFCYDYSFYSFIPFKPNYTNIIPKEISRHLFNIIEFIIERRTFEVKKVVGLGHNLKNSRKLIAFLNRKPCLSPKEFLKNLTGSSEMPSEYKDLENKYKPFLIKNKCLVSKEGFPDLAFELSALDEIDYASFSDEILLSAVYYYIWETLDGIFYLEPLQRIINAYVIKDSEFKYVITKALLFSLPFSTRRLFIYVKKLLTAVNGKVCIEDEKERETAVLYASHLFIPEEMYKESGDILTLGLFLIDLMEMDEDLVPDVLL